MPESKTSSETIAGQFPAGMNFLEVLSRARKVWAGDVLIFDREPGAEPEEPAGQRFPLTKFTVEHRLIEPPKLTPAEQSLVERLAVTIADRIAERMVSEMLKQGAEGETTFPRPPQDFGPSES